MVGRYTCYLIFAGHSKKGVFMSEDGKKVFVAYFNVSKAFDYVWTDGLFFQLYRMGITGTLWRLLSR